MAIPAVAGLPVDQSLGNLEGKELRFGTSAGADVGGADHEHLQRFCELHARQPQPDRRAGPAHGDVAQLHLGRRRRGAHQPVGLPHRWRVPCGPHGGPNPGIPGQEGRGAGDEARRLGLVDPSADDLSPRGPLRGHGLGHQGGKQSGGSRVFPSPLPVQLGLGQQRLRL